tara:strand:- start:1192 stop:2070 length:879 start_codon:yes stop_codon:yes gene_type:complete
MKVLNFLRPENGLTEDPLYYINFEKYESIARDCYLFMADFYGDLYSGKYEDKEKVALTLEEPNFCVVQGPKAVLHEKADTILSLCPYTSELFDNRTFVFFPFSEDWIPEETEKTIDVSYFGSLPTSVPWASYIQNVFTKYNFRFGHYSMGNVPRCSYADKIKMLSQTKVAVVHGLCNIDPGTASNYYNFPKGNDNKAFSHLDKGMAPQVKSRMFESAFSRCVILCQRDPWNPIEYWFEPEKEFMYFDDEEDLNKKLDHIINNYNEFDYMRQNAYNKAIGNYTTKHFVENYLI